MPTPRSLDRMLDHQFRRWERQATRPASAMPPPSIAISRLPGSAAAELGQELAQRLDFGFFGIEIVDLMARAQGMDRQLVAGLDEHVRNVIERYVMDAALRREFDENAYHEQLVRTVATLGERGLAVLLGRGSAFLLRPERTLRVLVVAPREERVERLAKRHDLRRDEAASRLAVEEAARLEFNRHHFHVDPDDPRHYDLVVNTGTLSTAGATDLVEHAMRTRFVAI